MARTRYIRQKPQLQNSESSSPNKDQVQSSSDEEINLSFQIKKTTVMKVKKSETLKNVKAMICEKEGIPENLQELSFAGNQIQDGIRIKDSAIPENSTVHLVPREPFYMKLYFKTPANEKTFDLEVPSMFTIEEIKSMIQDKEGIPKDIHSLYYAGKFLESYRTLASLNVENEATLQMISVPKDRVTILVETPEGLIKGDVRYTHVALDVKKILESITNIASEGYELFKGRMQLQNMKTLAYYEIGESDILKLLPAPYEISVNPICGMTFSLEVMQTDTICDVKHKIAEKDRGWPFDNQTLIFEGKRLDDEKYLASYGIKKGSTLHLSLRLVGGFKTSFQLI